MSLSLASAVSIPEDFSPGFGLVAAEMCGAVSVEGMTPANQPTMANPEAIASPLQVWRNGERLASNRKSARPFGLEPDSWIFINIHRLDGQFVHKHTKRFNRQSLTDA